MCFVALFMGTSQFLAQNQIGDYLTNFREMEESTFSGLFVNADVLGEEGEPGQAMNLEQIPKQPYKIVDKNTEKASPQSIHLYRLGYVEYSTSGQDTCWDL